VLQAAAESEREHGAATVDEYVAAIRACGGATLTSWVRAVGILRRMDELGVEVPLSAYAAAVDACALIVGGRGDLVPWKWALALLKEAEDRGLPLDEEIFLSAIGACGASLQWEWSLHLLEQARRRGIGLAQGMYERTIRACSQNQAWRQVLGLLESMQEGGMEPSPEAYGDAVIAVAMAEEAEMAAELLDRGARATYPQSLPGAAYVTVVHALERGSRWELALAVLRGMRSRGAMPSELVCDAVERACAAAGRPELAREVEACLPPQREGNPGGPARPRRRPFLAGLPPIRGAAAA